MRSTVAKGVAVALALSWTVAVAASGQTVLTVMDWRLNETPGTQKWFAEIKSGFEALHPDVTINYVTAAWGQPYLDKIVTGAAAGTAPDVAHLSIVWARDLWDQGALLKLNSFMSTSPDEAPSNFVPAIQWYVQKNGDYFGAPEGMDESLLIYNLDKFSDAGISADPNGITSWNQFRDVGKKLTRAGADGKISQFALSMGLSTESFNSWLVANDGSFYDTTLSHAAFNSAQGVETGEFLDALRRENLLGGDLRARTAAMGYGGEWSPYMFLANAPDLKFNLTSFPPGPSSDHRGATVWTNMYSIMKSSAHPELAWAFIRYYTSLESEVKQFRELNYAGMPRLSFWQNPAWRDLEVQYPWMKQVPEIATVGGVYPYLRSTKLGQEVWPVMNDGLTGKTPVKAAFDQAAKVYDQILAAVSSGI